MISETLPGESHTCLLTLDREAEEDQRNDYSKVQLAELNWVTSRTMGRGYAGTGTSQMQWCHPTAQPSTPGPKASPLLVTTHERATLAHSVSLWETTLVSWKGVFPSSCLQFLEPWGRTLGYLVHLSPPRHAMFTS